MAEDSGTIALEALRIRTTKALPDQVRVCLDTLSDEQIWMRPNEQSNSVGNLVLHLTGSLNHYLNRNLGGIEYKRDRDAEFAERKQIPRAELRKRFDDMVSKADKTFASLTPARLTDPSPDQKLNRFVLEDLINIAVHLSTHTGQIVWITKMLRGGGLDEVWMRTHRSSGAWPR